MVCPCGGGCPRCTGAIQAKLKVGRSGDEYEREADRIADQVMRMPGPGIEREAKPGELEEEEKQVQRKPLAESITPLIQGKQEYSEEEEEPVIPIQRSCDGCSEEGDETLLQKKGDGTPVGIAPTGLQPRIDSLCGNGRPLDEATRAFFEPRFGTDFSHVQIHDYPGAADSARSLNARAFTVGRDIVFGSGEYSPHAPEGKQLLGHELAHVLQQAGRKPEYLQRMAIGQGAPPADWGYNIQVVPVKERKRVQSAIAKVEEVAAAPGKFKKCHDFYKRNCPGGSPTTLRDIVRRARIWRITDSSMARGDINGVNIAYTESGYNSGAHNLAETLMHELLHNCGIPGTRTHYLAELGAMYCMGGRNISSLTIGADLSTGTAQLLYSYRRILLEMASGRIQLTVGGDINILGTTFAILQGIGRRPSGLAADIGSGMVGVQGRSNFLWGGERFGGITGSVETGFGAGVFQMRNPNPGDWTGGTHFAGSFVLQLGMGAEFFIPFGLSSGQGVGMSIGALYRLVQPLNEKGKQIHGLLGSISFHF